MSSVSKHCERARDMWRWCLASACRTALACTIVGCITLYGPPPLIEQLAFPAFSYVTVILIVTDATLGDTLRGCWLALYATLQSIGPAILSLYFIGPSRFSSGTISVAVAIAAFVVALPEGTHLVSKRIALGQIVLVYVIAFIKGVHTEPIMHPLHVAASTALGVFASVLALLLPFPRLALLEVKQNCKILAGNSLERLKLYVKAFCAEEKAQALASISQIKPLTLSASKLLSAIKRHNESAKWERIPFKFLRSYYMNPGERLQELEMPLRGMEMAFTSGSTVPVIRVPEGESNKSVNEYLEEHVTITMKQMKKSMPSKAPTVPESNAENITKSFQSLQPILLNPQDLPSLFFLFCMKLIRSKSLSPPANPESRLDNNNKLSTSNTTANDDEDDDEVARNKILNSIISSFMISNKRFMPALKCSLSLGLAVLFGLMYSKENGYWSGLPVAISLAAAREATFKVANIKAQGTVIGTVYGVVGCFIFERFMPIRFLSLLPWFIVTSFLRISKMYGQAGGISAVIGALLILGRKKFGPPSEFAIARIIETFIGLSCSIAVELILHPTRAASLAKIQLCKSFEALHECVDAVSLLGAEAANNLLEKQKRVKLEVSELGKLIGEAEVEPNFWYLPFHSVCYRKLLVSLSKMVDLMLFSAQAIGFLEQESPNYGPSWKECVHELESNLEALKQTIGSSARFFAGIARFKSLAELEKLVETNDVEKGKSWSKPKVVGNGEGSDAMSWYLQHCKEMVEKLGGQADKTEEEEEIRKREMILNVGALAFCMSNLMKEIKELEKSVNDLVQWENPSTNINLNDLSSKIHYLYK